MNTGRCIANEYEESLGCLADVLDHLDQRLIPFIFKLHSYMILQRNISSSKFTARSFQPFSQVFW